MIRKENERPRHWRPVTRRSLLSALPLLPALRHGCAAGAVALEQRLLDELEKIEIADTHEHLFDERERLNQQVDFFALVQAAYTGADLVSAGMPREALRVVRDQNATDPERWHALEPYWKFVRFTGYGQALRLAMWDLYGIGEISAATIRPLNEAIRRQNRAGLYRHVLRDRARIRFLVEDDSCGGCVKIANPPQNAGFMVLARRFDKFVIPSTPRDVGELESMSGVSITSLAGLQRALERNFEQNLGEGMRAVKVALAYSRELRFEEVAPADAERDLHKLLHAGVDLPQGFRTAFQRPFRRLEDHMFHRVMALADAHHLPVQIHTGAFAGTGGVITNSKPTLLTNTFLLYPKIRFDIFHLSFPYQQELGALAKSFPNVYADFCWAYVLSPLAARRALDEYLETVPLNKLLGFGGDYKHVELTYAHARMARQTMARVLAGKIESGFCTEREAVEIGRTVLYENAARVFSWREA